jgi:ribosomal protein L6P/L9E
MHPRRILLGQCIRKFSTSLYRASNVGTKRLTVPPGVTLKMSPPPPPKRTKYFQPSARHHPLGGPSARESDSQTVTVTGPLGSLEIDAPQFISLVPAWTVDPRLEAQITEIEGQGKIAPERNDLTVVVKDTKSRKQREMWGTVRALLHNSIQGVSGGHQTTLTLKGVGYRGALIEDGKMLELKVGFNHNVNAEIPEGVEVSMTNPTLFEVKCIDKEKMGLFCARVRRLRPPEPYKGKVSHTLRFIEYTNVRVYLLETRLSRLKKLRKSRPAYEYGQIYFVVIFRGYSAYKLLISYLRIYITDSKSITNNQALSMPEVNNATPP